MTVSSYVVLDSPCIAGEIVSRVYVNGVSPDGLTCWHDNWEECLRTQVTRRSSSTESSIWTP